MKILKHEYTTQRCFVPTEIDKITTVPFWIATSNNCEYCNYRLDEEETKYITAVITTDEYLMFFHHECFEKSKKEAGEKE